MSTSLDIGAFFQRYEWSFEQLEETVWRGNFANDAGDDFDLYVMVNDEWVHIAISPFTPRPSAQCEARVHSMLLTLNQRIRLAYFGIDDDGDINLLMELPASNFTYELFSIAIDILTYYTDALAVHLGRMATEPDYSMPLADSH